MFTVENPHWQCESVIETLSLYVQRLWIGKSDRKQSCCSHMDHEMSPDSIFNRLFSHHEMASFKIFLNAFFVVVVVNEQKQNFSSKYNRTSNNFS